MSSEERKRPAPSQQVVDTVYMSAWGVPITLAFLGGVAVIVIASLTYVGAV